MKATVQTVAIIRARFAPEDEPDFMAKWRAAVKQSGTDPTIIYTSDDNRSLDAIIDVREVFKLVQTMIRLGIPTETVK